MQAKIQAVLDLIRSKDIRPTTSSEEYIANALEKALRQVFEDNVVCVGGEGIHVYEEDTGLWRQLSDHYLTTMALAFNGKRIGMSASKAAGVVRCLKHSSIYQPDFFTQPLRGVAFTNAVLKCTAEGIQEVAASPDHRLQVCLPHTYAPTEPCKWLELLNDIFEEDEDKDEKIAVLQEFLGAALIGTVTQYDKCMIFVGSGANGKSTLIDVLKLLVDKSGISAIPPQKWDHEYYLALLDKKIFNLVAEIPDKAMTDSDRFKAVVSGDEVIARMPYSEPAAIRPVAGHIFAANALPATVDDTDGFWRKFIILSFNRKFDGSKTRTEIVESLMPEVPGIVRWCLEGAVRRMSQDDYTEPTSSKKILAAWRIDSDSVNAWSDLYLHKMPRPDSNANTYLEEKGQSSSALISKYTNWCLRERYMPVGARKFKTRLESLGFSWQRLASGVYWWVSITDTSAPEVPEIVEN